MPRTYVVTGSASGIGRALTDRLAGEGHRVVGVDVADAVVVADLATQEGRRAMVEEVRAATGGVVDAVVANAGVQHDDELAVRVNYFGAVATLEGLRPLLAEGTDPRAVATCSVAVLGPLDEPLVDACLAGDEEAAVEAAASTGLLTYGSTKRALARWMRRVAATEAWAGAGIALNAVGPGVIETPMTRELLASAEGRELVDTAVPMPLSGHGRPEDVAAAIAWLASPENRLACGQVLFVDGGADVVQRGDDVW